MRIHVSLALAAVLGLTLSVVGCDNRSGATHTSPSPRVSPVAYPAPPGAAIPFQFARALR